MIKLFNIFTNPAGGGHSPLDKWCSSSRSIWREVAFNQKSQKQLNNEKMSLQGMSFSDVSKGAF